MDEYQKLAFELDLLLYNAQRTFPRDEFLEGTLRDARDEFRFLSKTWRKPISSFAPKEKDV